MATVVGIDHIVISVRHFKKSREFYDRLLGFLGFRVLEEYKDAVGWTNGTTRYWIRKVKTLHQYRHHHRGAVGFDHYAFQLKKRKDVDELYRFLKKQKKVKILDKPKEYTEYGKGYYAVYFADPDGLRLEGMYCPK